jgi:hypothetical protein
MDSLIGLAEGSARLSNGGLALLKKIPLIGDYIRYREGTERTENAVNEKFINEYKILNDPLAQTEFINSFDSEIEKKAIVGHILDIKADRQKDINVAEILNQVYQNSANVDEKDVDNKQMDPDWWLLWLDKAKMTSNPLKQSILAKALETENKKQGTVSAKFIRVLADLSNDNIELFRKYLGYFSLAGQLYTGSRKNNADLLSLTFDFHIQRELEETGLVRFATGLGEYRECNPINIDKEKAFLISFFQYSILIWTERLQLELAYALSLTSEGQTLRNLISFSVELDYLKNVSKVISSSLKCKVTIHENEPQDDTQDDIIKREPIFCFSIEPI